MLLYFGVVVSITGSLDAFPFQPDLIGSQSLCIPLMLAVMFFMYVGVCIPLMLEVMFFYVCGCAVFVPTNRDIN